jgi:hypothetical protein
VSPGLINAHDHITYDGNDPKPVPQTYNHRHEWRRGVNGAEEIDVPSTRSTTAIQWTELRQLLAGTTSIVGSGGTAGMLRNLDDGFPASESNTEGLDYDAEYETFPLDDIDGTLLNSGCNYDDVAAGFTIPSDCYHAHVAEGTNVAARNEFLCMAGLQSGGVDATENRSAFVHMIPLKPSDVLDVATVGTAVVWSPRSNIALYGATAPVTMMDSLGVEMTLGTDWTASGSATILRELACADYLNTNHYNEYFSARKLWRLVTYGAAEALLLDGLIGKMEVGYQGDISIFLPNGETDPFAQVVRANQADVALTLRSGLTLAGDTDVVDQMPDWSGSECEAIQPRLDGKQKSACVQREFGTDFASLQSANNNYYGIAWNGEPTGEPSCMPARDGEFDGITATDSDGDGVEDSADNCPLVFNPILPVNDGVQADFDGDSLGDVCDPCPLSEEAECDPNDYDSDGFDNDNDNCPYISNEDQTDSDSDMIGDVCDACPEFSNLDGEPCPAPERTIYEIKQERLTGEARVEGVVTVVDGSAFFVQVPEAEHDETLGYRFSGIYVFGSGDGLSVGDRVEIDGVVEEFFGQLQYSGPSVEVLSSGNPVPDPVVVSPSDVGTGIDNAEPELASQSLAYEAVLIEVQDAEVTTDGLIPTRCCGASDWGVDDILRIGDEFFESTPPPIGSLVTVTGPLMLRYEDHRLMPRSESDIVVNSLADPRVESITGTTEPVFAQQDGSNLTFNTPLTITLDRAAPAGGIDVTVGSLTADVLVDTQVSFSEGETSQTIGSIALGSSPPTVGDSVTIVAETIDSSAQITVQTYDAGALRAVDRVDPSPLQFTTMSSNVVEVFLDAPAGAGGVTVEVSSDNSAVLAADQSSYSVAEGDLSTEVTLDSGMSEGTGLVTFSISGSNSLQVDFTVSEVDTSLGLVLSEVFYDADTGSAGDAGWEWIEFYNGSGDSVDLSDYVIGRWGGSTSGNFEVFALSGTLTPGQCAVVGGPTSDANNYSPTFDIVFDYEGAIENSGSEGDGVAIYPGGTDPVTASSIPSDVVIYGPNNAKGIVGPDGTVIDAQVGDANKGESIARTTEGWEILATPTPGACALTPDE